MIQKYSRYKILELFFKCPKKIFHIREISRLSKLAVPSVKIHLDELIKENLVLKSKEDFASIVDTDWHDYYKGRTDHPISEAENVIIGDNKRMLKIGKHIFTEGIQKEKQGEFIGLWKFTPEGTNIFLKHFDRLNSTLKMTDPYQNAKEWQKSYITDIFQEMIDNGEKLHCVVVKKGWKEFDTVQDFHNVGGEPPEGVEKVEI